MQVAGIGDLNGDGKDDVVWRTETGVDVWLMDGTAAVSTGHAGNASQAWHIQGTGDFNGDGKDDLIWRNDDGRVGMSLLDGITAIAAADVGVVPATWHVGLDHFDFV